MNTDATYVEIIHISDPHYGDHHVFTMEPTPDGKAPPSLGMPTLAEKLIEDLTDPAQEPIRPFVEGLIGGVGPGGFPGPAHAQDCLPFRRFYAKGRLGGIPTSRRRVF
jgi:hypothetical protein